MNKLYKEQKEQIQQISYKHTLKVLKWEISVVFYDVTALYFQIDAEMRSKKKGGAKEGKHQNQQIILGLLVSTGNYPLTFYKFEEHTMLPIIDTFKEKYKLKNLTIIADSGLLLPQNTTLISKHLHTTK